MGLTDPTPIRSPWYWPVMICWRLRPAAAQGKTVAYALPLLQKLFVAPQARGSSPRPVQMLVLVPTRELAAKMGSVVAHLAAKL